eukprot:jgi/Mesvir1/14951/Mv25493-RA.1
MTARNHGSMARGASCRSVLMALQNLRSDVESSAFTSLAHVRWTHGRNLVPLAKRSTSVWLGRMLRSAVMTCCEVGSRYLKYRCCWQGQGPAKMVASSVGVVSRLTFPLLKTICPKVGE